MKQPLPSYLRMYRRSAGLTQRELAFMLGLHDGREISAYERLLRTPNGRTMVGCHIIFGKSADDVFPGVYREVELLLAQRASTLSLSLKKQNEPEAHQRKLELLSAIAAVRAASYHKKKHEPYTKKSTADHGDLP